MAEVRFAARALLPAVRAFGEGVRAGDETGGGLFSDILEGGHETIVCLCIFFFHLINFLL